MLASGNSLGVVDVYRTFGLEHAQVSQADQIQRLLTSITTNDFSSDSKGDGSAGNANS